MISLFILVGCAREITDKRLTDASGNSISQKQIEFTFSFEGTLFFGHPNYKYYLVVSTQNIATKVIPQAFNTYVTFPGALSIDTNKVQMSYFPTDITKGLQDVYDEYFVSWNYYISYDNTDHFLQDTGPFISSVNAGTGLIPLNNVHNVAGVASTQIKWTMPSTYDDFYFDFLAVDDNSYIQHSTGVVHFQGNDLLNQPNQNFANKAAGINSGLVIVSYNVRTYEF